MFVDTSRKYRNFEGFGASGAWWAQLVGGWPCRDEIVRLLYSPDDGNMQMLYFKNAEAVFSSFTAAPETVRF